MFTSLTYMMCLVFECIVCAAPVWAGEIRKKMERQIERDSGKSKLYRIQFTIKPYYLFLFIRKQMDIGI